ncbi:hypothetical protein OSTOST_22493, partial [Ostertagia ostertagi]
KRAKDERRRINRSFNAFLLDSDEEVEESAVDYDGILTVNDDGEESDDDTPEERVFDEDGCSFDVKKLSPYIFEKESVIFKEDVVEKLLEKRQDTTRSQKRMLEMIDKPVGK